MKNLKKIIALSLFGVMTAGLLTGCMEKSFDLPKNAQSNAGNVQNNELPVMEGTEDVGSDIAAMEDTQTVPEEKGIDDSDIGDWYESKELGLKIPIPKKYKNYISFTDPAQLKAEDLGVNTTFIVMNGSATDKTEFLADFNRYDAEYTEDEMMELRPMEFYIGSYNGKTFTMTCAGEASGDEERKVYSDLVNNFIGKMYKIVEIIK